ncbi:MAG: sigma-70 family RNA polymerase sigma factor [Desulfobacteraceae bacterium]|jgi:RNA polymerase sigma-70 factor (ECF subfamily)
MLDEIAILDRAKQGNQEAIAHLVMKYQQLVRHYLYSLAPDPSIADDLTQDVFVKLFDSIERIDPDRGIKPYLMRITRNMAIDNWRKIRNRRKRNNEILFCDLEQYYEPLPAAYKAEEISPIFEALNKCLETLNERILRVIKSFYYENLSCREIGRTIGKSESNIRTMLHRGRKALYQCISKRIKEFEQVGYKRN